MGESDLWKELRRMRQEVSRLNEHDRILRKNLEGVGDELVKLRMNLNLLNMDDPLDLLPKKRKRGKR